MANQEQLEILKQGVEVWNKWREDNPDAKVDLSEIELRRAALKLVHLAGADLTKTNLGGAYLWGSNFSEAHLKNAFLWNANLYNTNLEKACLRNASLVKACLEVANLVKADLTGAELTETILVGADLREARLWRADLKNANLTGADLTDGDLRGAGLRGANLTGTILKDVDLRLADLTGAELRNADLRRANLQGANLTKTNLTGAKLDSADLAKSSLAGTILADLNLNNVEGLKDIDHLAPSQISTDVIQRAQENLPEIFLRGCGLSDWEIEHAKLYNPDLSNDEITQIQYKVYELRAGQALQISPLFISYSHSDSEYVDKIGDNFISRGIRYWRDIHDMRSGRIEKQIDRAIRHNPTVLLILSENSIKSDWVEHEVRTARELEKELGRDTLCPIALDDSWKSSPWPKRVMEQVMEYNILDFSEWEDDVKFEGMFRKLIGGLELFYKG